RLDQAAARMIDKTDLAPLDQYLVKNYAENELAKWAQNKFGKEFTAEEFVVRDSESIEGVIDSLMSKAREAYADRAVNYPIEFAIDMTNANMQQNPQQALEQFCRWVKARYEIDWSPTSLPSPNPAELRRILIDE